MYTVYLCCIMYTVYCILYTCTLYTVHFTQYTVYCILYTLYNCIIVYFFWSFTARMGAWGPVPCRLGRLPRAPGGLPGEGPGPKVQPSIRVEPSWFSHRNLGWFWCRFGVVLGSLLGPSWGSLSLLLALFSVQVGPGTVFEQSCLRKSDCPRNHMFYKGLGRFWAQDGAPKRPKIAPRRVQDRLGSLFFPLDFSIRF